MSPWSETAFIVLLALVMLVGLLGTVVPIFPGVVIIWLATLVYGLVIGFGTLGGWLFAGLTVLMIIGTLIDNIMMATGAKRGGASWWAIAAGILAGLVGTWLLPPIGGLVAAPLTLLLIEFLNKRDWQAAYQSTRGLLLGCGWSFIIRFGIGLIMIGLWGLWVWRG